QIERTRANDRREPCDEAPALGIEERRGAPHLRERVGNDLLGIRRITDDRHGQGEGHAPIAIVELAERAFITGSNARDDRHVGSGSVLQRHWLRSGGCSRRRVRNMRRRVRARNARSSVESVWTRRAFLLHALVTFAVCKRIACRYSGRGFLAALGMTPYCSSM